MSGQGADVVRSVAGLVAPSLDKRAKDEAICGVVKFRHGNLRGLLDRRHVEMSFARCASADA
jgi:hypothetical protein